MRYSIFFLLILSTFSFESEARFFGRRGGGFFNRPLFRRQPIRTVFGGGMRMSPCGPRGCGSQGGCGPRGCGAQRSGGCGPQGCGPQVFSNHNNNAASDVVAPAPEGSASTSVSRLPSGQRPIEDTAPLADVVADPAASSTPVKSKKDTAREELLANGWEERECNTEFCTFVKDGKEKHLFNDGRVEDVGVGTESIDAIAKAAKEAEQKEQASKPQTQPQPQAQKHGFRYVKGTSGLGIQASELAAALAQEEKDGGTNRVILTFGTTWCGPCNKASGVLSRVSSSQYPGVTAIKVLVNENGGQTELNNAHKTTVPGLAKFPHNSYPTAYVLSKDSSGKFTLENISNIHVVEQSADQIMAQIPR